MDPSRTHLTRLPPGFIAVRILQLASTIAILASSIVAIALSFDSAGLEWATLVSAALTLVILTWMMLATYKFFKAYNYWAVLSMEILLFIIWIDGFVWALGGAFNVGYEYYDYTSECDTNYNSTLTGYTEPCPDGSSYNLTAGNAAISSAAFSACNMLLFLVSLIVVSVYIARHRSAGGHNKIGSLAPVYPVQTDPRLLQQSDLELRQQNLALQQQYLALQQQHFELQRNGGMTMPPLAATQMGQANLAGGADLEKGAGVDWEREVGGHYAPVQSGMPQMQQVQPGVASGSGQREVVESEKGKERMVDEQINTGGVQGVVAEDEHETTDAPHLEQ